MHLVTQIFNHAKQLYFDVKFQFLLNDDPLNPPNSETVYPMVTTRICQIL